MKNVSFQVTRGQRSLAAELTMFHLENKTPAALVISGLNKGFVQNILTGFPWFSSSINAWFHDFPGLENVTFKFQDFSGSVRTLLKVFTFAKPRRLGYDFTSVHSVCLLTGLLNKKLSNRAITRLCPSLTVTLISIAHVQNMLLLNHFTFSIF